MLGEVACTGVHGANRLASNSLLEGLVYGIRIADHLLYGAIDSDGQSFQRATSFITYDNKLDSAAILSSGRADNRISLQVRHELRQLMWKYVSLCRDREGLLTARQAIGQMRQRLTASADREVLETVNMLQVAELVVAAALERRESRGSHWRFDYQEPDENLAQRHYAFQPLYIDPYGLAQLYKEATLHV